MNQPLRLFYTGQPPTRAHDDDAGLDLYVVEDQIAWAESVTDIDLGCSVKAPEGTWLLLCGRSSTYKHRGLRVEQGIIDTGYTGPLYATVTNTSTNDIHLKKGERIAQLVVMPNLTARTEIYGVKELPSTTRGDQGFGSTGR